MSHKHWYIQAYKHRMKISTGGFTIDDFVEVQVNASDEKEALIKAKKNIKRKYYRVFKVWDCEQEHELDQEMRMQDLEVKTKLLKLLK